MTRIGNKLQEGSRSKFFFNVGWRRGTLVCVIPSLQKWGGWFDWEFPEIMHPLGTWDIPSFELSYNIYVKLTSYTHQQRKLSCRTNGPIAPCTVHLNSCFCSHPHVYSVLFINSLILSMPFFNLSWVSVLAPTRLCLWYLRKFITPQAAGFFMWLHVSHVDHIRRWPRHSSSLIILFTYNHLSTKYKLSLSK